MRKHIGLFIGILLVVIFFAGCSGKSPNITISIESFSPYAAIGYVEVDGIRVQNFSLSLFNKTMFIVEKTLLPLQDMHNVSVSLYSVENASQLTTVSCTEVTSKVTFVISVNHNINIRSFE